MPDNVEGSDTMNSIAIARKALNSVAGGIALGFCILVLLPFLTVLALAVAAFDTEQVTEVRR